MHINPFIYGKEVSGDNFYDRTEDYRRLVSTIEGGSANVVLYAPRRYGKTSLAKKALDELSRRGFACLYFDMMKVGSVASFCEAYAASAYALERGTARAMRRIASALASLRPKFAVGEDGRPTLELDIAAPVPSSSVEAALDLPETLCAGRRTAVVVFDEFQEIAGLSPDIPLEGVFRSCIQRHKSVRYVFLGSKTHLMKRMFGDRTRPFYNSASVQRLGLPPEEESRAFVSNRFADCGIHAGEDAVRRIVGAAGNQPYYVQAIAAQVFELAVAVGRASVAVADADAAVERLVDAKRDLWETTVQSLSPGQRTLLTALAKEPAGRFDERYRRRHGLGASSTVHSALDVLQDKGIVESENGRFALGDPVFARYLLASPFEIVRG